MSDVVHLANVLGRWLVAHLGRLSLELAVLAAVVLAVIRLLRVRSPRLRHLFWCLVLAKPVVTFLVASPVSLYWFLAPPQLEPPPVVRPAVVERAQARPARPLLPYRRAAPSPLGAAPVERPPWWAGFDAYGAVALVWVLGATALVLRLTVGFAFVSFLRHTAVVQPEGPLPEAMARAAERLGVRRGPRVALSSVVHGPVLAGILRPVVLLPQSVHDRCTMRQVEMVLAHEAAHARRLDNLALLVQRLAEVVLFVHPVVWLCGWAMRREAEAACDYAVVEAYGDSAAYADSLTRVAEMRAGLTRKLLVNTFAAAESNLRGRVRRITGGRLSGRTLRWTVVSVAALLIVAGFGLPTAARKAPGGTEEKKAMHDVTTDLKYGFRKDPMDWVETDGSLQGALVRTLVFGQPHEGDSELIEAEVDEVLAAQLPDGRLSDDPNHSLQFTSEALIRLARMGCPADRPEVKKAVEAILGKDKPNQADPLGIYDVRALCMLGLAGEGEYREFARQGLHRCLAAEDEWGDISEGCPWTPIEHLITLYHGRAQVETEPVVRRWVQRIADNVNAAGCWSFKDPWGFVRLASEVEGPEARELLTKEVPLILRSQRDDGGWGDKSLFVFRGLKRHGLLESLRERPPLPASWRVVRSIPAPKGNLGTMTWLDGALYVVDWESGHLLALSPEDGSVVRRLPFPEGGAAGVGRWGGSLAVTQGKPRKRLLKLNPRTGAVEREVPLQFMEEVMSATEVDGRLWVADGWIFPGNVVDPDDPSTHEGGDAYDLPRLEPHLAGPCPSAFAVTTDGVWHTDYFAEAMIKSGAEGKLLDYTERPFGWTSGIAWDGEHLWAIDNAGGRICQIARADAEQLAHDGGGRTTGRQGLDFSKVDLKADDLTHDSFSLSVQAAAGLLGRDVDYETVYVLSTNCFAPGIRPGEPCKRSWVQQARSRSIDLVARGVGLDWTYPPNTEELNDIPEAPDAPWSSPATDAWLREWHRKPMVPHVRRLISEGKVIVSQGEWKVVPRNIGLSWCAWGIITGATDDGEIVGVSVNGQLDSPTDHIRDGHVLSPGEPTLTGREADLAVLERAVHRIRGDADPYRPDRNFVFGLAAMDEWIAQMERPSFQPDCAPDSHDSRENAFATAMTFSSGADVAARWLRGRAEKFSDDATTQLESAAAHYERCVALLHPALTGDGGEHYREFIGDPEKQKAHADLLRQVKAELAAAADDMEAALAAEGVEVTGSLQQDGGGKSVDMAGPDYAKLKLSGDGWTQETFSLSLVAVAQSFGRETTYEEICARSGQAFAPAIDFVNDCKDLLQCQGWLGHLCPMDVAAASVGLEMEPLPLPPYEGEPQDAAARAAHHDACAKVIADALANGDAVIISGGWEFEEGPFVEPWWAGIVTDVRTDGTVIGMHLRGGANCKLSSISPGEVFAVRPAAERAGLPAVHRRMLQEAVRRIRSRGPYASGEYCVFGLDATDEWIRVMRECEGFCPVCQQRNGTGWAAAVKNAEAVSDRCTVAASYLRRIAPDFPPEAAGRLEAAAARYDRIIELLTPALTGRGGEHYRQFVGDLEKQKAHADDVLADVKAELAAAADDMAAALAAEGVAVAQGGPPAASAGVPAPEQIELAGHTYDLVWIAPDDLASAKLKLTGNCELRADDAEHPAIYRDHVDPLYNIHCELAGIDDGPLEGEDWPEYWRRLAEGLSGKVECFALAAYCDGKLAGHVRFFPGNLAHLRFGPQEFAGAADSRTLLVGAGAVDLAGARDGLEAELLRRVTAYAGQRDYERVRALGWSNVRPYAMWGESLPVTAYEACGFERAGSFEAPDPAALSDMLAGSHGPDVQRMVREAMAGGVSEDEANRLHAMELRLTTDGERTGTPDTERLWQWANIFGGGREKLLAGAERCPEVLDLLELEGSLEPISDEARAVRRHMSGLEPAEWDYADQIEEALAAIAAGSAPAARDRRVRERLEYVDKRRQALFHWLDGTPQSEAEEAEDTDPDAVRLTYSLLGAPDEEKRRLVQMLADKLGPDDVSREDLKGLEESEKLAPFAHRIDMHGYQLWSFDQNHELLLRGIARGRALGEWHEPGGPLAWGDGDPDDRAKVRAMLSRLEAWLDGAPDTELGTPDDYKEKEWLARCLALYLRDHLANYYNWYVDQTMTANVQHEDGKTWLEGLERFPSWMTQPGGYVACSRYLGFRHSPAWVYGGSGFAFALNVHRMLCPSGPTAWQDQHCNGLAGNMGLDTEQLLVFSGDEQAPAKREAHFERACEAIDAGLPIIGWEMDIPDYYVVCGYDEDGNYLFRDFDDSVNRIHHAKLGDTGIGVHYLLVVRPGEPAEDDAVVRDALEFALEVAAGQYGHGGEYATGVAGYDQWIAALQEPEAMLEAEASGHGLAYNAACWAECRRYAASFLEEARRRLDREELEADFEAAIEHYGTAAARLGEVSELFPMNPAEPEAMTERLRDASRREKALAALRAARTAEVAGLRALSRVAVALGVDEERTQALEETLSSTGEALQQDGGGVAPASVRREDGKVWIEGVPTMAWGESSDTTFVGAMAAALAATDHPYTQNQVMGYSGLAFRVRWAGDAEHSEKGWCPSIPVGEFPEVQAAVARATGWRFDILDEMADEQNPRMERYADRIAAAIEAGLPVVGYPDTGDLNVAVAYGVGGEGDERRFLWRTYWSSDGAKAVPAAETGPWVMIPVEFGGAPDARQRLLDTLAIAVRNWHRDGSESLTGYRYAWGERALEAWGQDLPRASEFTEEQQKQLFFLNWWNFEAWQDARVRAAQFLQDEAVHLTPPGREAVQRAAGLYAQEGALLQGQIGEAEAFFGPWSGKGFEDWTAEVRGREQEVLARALELERQAIAALADALQAEGANVPAGTA